ncbi:MAG: hypothetical protein R2688_01320 [Fimbriimonadaceae bacterium]
MTKTSLGVMACGVLVLGGNGVGEACDWKPVSIKVIKFPVRASRLVAVVLKPLRLSNQGQGMPQWA